MSSERKTTQQRGFWFFFWLSASLFLIAAANWIFNNFIGISKLISDSLGISATSYLWGVVVLFFSVFLVAALLNLAYNTVSNVRLFLDGLLGLTTQRGSLETVKEKRTTYVELAKNDPRIKNEDIGLLFSSEMEHYGSFWLFFVGLAIGMLETLLILVVAVGTGVGNNGVQSIIVYLGYLAIASVGGLVAFTIGFWLVLPRFGKDPSTVRLKRFREYLDAKDTIAERDKNPDKSNSTKRS